MYWVEVEFKLVASELCTLATIRSWFVVITKKPEWIRVKGVDESILNRIEGSLDQYRPPYAKTPCAPIWGPAFQQAATFMILGTICTRNCSFCGVDGGKPLPPDFRIEALHVAQAAQDLGLRHVVITSVTRDDLPDGEPSVPGPLRQINRLLPEAEPMF